MTFKDFARGFAWRAAFALGGIVLGVALGLFLFGKVDLKGLLALAVAAGVTGAGGAAAAKKAGAAEVKALDAEVEKARLKAEEEERAKIGSISPGDAMGSLTAEARERIAQAGRDAVARVLERQGR